MLGLQTAIKMGDISIVATEWRTVQVGRIVVLQSGAEAGRLAAIVEIVDHKRVRSQINPPKMKMDGPKTRVGDVVIVMVMAA